ncbi:MAG TPA: single-stranded-DNA-specific exonuclease RecJ [Oscillatoriaceae cyanobacterium]
MANWNVRPADEGEVQRIARTCQLPTPVARLLWLRGYTTPEAVRDFAASRESLAYLEQPLDSDGMQKAVKRIKQAVDSGERMVIYGDYDCDGVTSTSLLYRYLKRGLNANVTAYLPDRFKDGYGITVAAVERLAKDGVKLILTCDNGISAHAAAEKAKECGVELVVTDHHQVPEVLPDVHAIVHPQVDFPHLRDLAGVGVAYLFAIALEGAFTPRMEHFLDFATIGTIGDVVPLNGPNRPLVWAGLGRYREGKFRFPGLRALGEVSRTNFERLTTEDVGFQLVPRLNAAGRLETPDVGFKLLTTNDKAEAAEFAGVLDGINRQRKEMSTGLTDEVCARIDAEWDLESEPFLVLADENFHHGITGIVAGRLKERYRAPVLIFSGHGDGVWKASGRSPEGLHLYEALHAVRENLLGFGGHAGAAGCSAPGEAIPLLRAGLNRYVREIGWKRPDDLVWLDAELPFAEATEALLEQLDRMEPFGQKNPAPVFGLMRARVLGRRTDRSGKHLFLKLDDGESIREVTWWNHGPEAETLPDWVKLTYRPRMSTYQGLHVEFVADRLEAAEPPPAIRLERTVCFAEIDDRRGQTLPEAPQLAYSLSPPEQGTWLDPLREPPLSCGELVLLDVPEDRETLRTLASRAERLTLAWKETDDEPALTPEWLLECYKTLAAEQSRPLAQAIARVGGYRALTAVRLLREAGLLVEHDGFWQLLAPNDAAIAVSQLASFRIAEEARAFRARLRRAPLDEIVAEAQYAVV